MPNLDGSTARDTKPVRMMERFKIKNVSFENRVLRSSLGGQLAAADGAVTDVWRNFERRFARTGVAGLISATVSVSETRYSPIYYPALSRDEFTGPLRDAVRRVKEGTDCRYILQIGDPGSHTQTSLFSQAEDGKSASGGFDLLYGYRNRSVTLSKEEIPAIVTGYANAARRVRDAGCDGVEITASKGYLIHQFLNPSTNRRDDEYGGDEKGRFRLLGEIMRAVRAAVGPDFLLGVRMSARDHNFVPVNLRLPPVWPLRHWTMGNDLPETLYFAEELERLGADYLHLSNGFGFINPRENPGAFPVPEVRRIFNSTRHLSFKAAVRSTFMNMTPKLVLKALFGIGWNTKNLGETGKLSAEFRRVVKIPIIANGGFQSRKLIEETLATGDCDMVSMARPLLANPDLLRVFQTADEPDKPCTFCNRCSILTAIGPVGCYEPERFASQDEMERAILRLTTDPDGGAPAVSGRTPVAAAAGSQPA